jgi:hypothetical protein
LKRGSKGTSHRPLTYAEQDARFTIVRSTLTITQTHTDTNTHRRTHARTHKHTHTHTNKHTRTRTHTHAHNAQAETHRLVDNVGVGMGVGGCADVRVCGCFVVLAKRVAQTKTCIKLYQTGDLITSTWSGTWTKCEHFPQCQGLLARCLCPATSNRRRRRGRMRME